MRGGCGEICGEIPSIRSVCTLQFLHHILRLSLVEPALKSLALLQQEPRTAGRVCVCACVCV